jgi:hypothetical protein
VTTPNLPGSPDTNYHYNKVDFEGVHLENFYDDLAVESGTNWTANNFAFLNPVRYSVYIQNLNNSTCVGLGQLSIRDYSYPVSFTGTYSGCTTPK